MASPQIENGYLRLAHDLVQAIARAQLKPAESSCLLCIADNTYGWNRKTAPLALSFFCEWTGYSLSVVRRALRGLLDRNIITAKRGRPVSYGVQKDYEKWRAEVVPTGGQHAEMTSKMSPRGNNLVVPTGGQQLRKKKEEKNIPERNTWLTPYATEWQDRYGGKMEFGIAAKYLKPLHDEHGPEKTLAHFKNFIEQTEATFVSYPRFAQTFGSWNPNKNKGRRPPSHIAMDPEHAAYYENRGNG